jgi:guanosine-3',5'-bis(diphosphate) 3'-pyrophosphohydrolase
MTKATFEDAVALAANSHKGQLEKAGTPYLLHPLRVMMSLGRSATEAERCAAVLHDVVEDCDVSFDDLRKAGFSEEVVEAVDALTKRPDEASDYMKAIRRVAQNPIARRVKLRDLADNLDLTRIPNPTDKDRARAEKYLLAQSFLEGLENSS